MKKLASLWNRVHALSKAHPKPVFATTVICIAILIGLFFRFYGQNKPVYTTQVTEFSLKDVGKLVTQEGCYTSIQTLRNSRDLFGVQIPLTEKKYVYSMDGTVSAGIDFEQIEVVPDEESQIITVLMPPAEIFNVTPNEDSFTIYHDGDNLFNGLHLEETSESRKEMVEEIRAKAIEYDILGHAQNNAEVLITAFIGQTYDLDTWQLQFQTK